MENKKNNAEFIYTKIKEMIMEDKFKPNEKINQLELANILGVSKTPVVKALYRLSSEGLVENISNRGFYLVQISLQELVDLLRIRQAFDRVLAESLIKTATEQEIKTMRLMFEKFIDCNFDEDKFNEYWETDKRFHEYLLEICHNKWIAKIDGNFHIYARVYRGGLIRKPEETLPEHLRIIDAIEKKDLEKAVSELGAHVQASIEVLENAVKTLDDFGYTKK